VAPLASASINACSSKCRSDTTFSVTGDDTLVSVYIDGLSQHLCKPTTWQDVCNIPLPGKASVIACYATNTNKAGGLLGSTPDGIGNTDADWKCVNSIKGIEDVWYRTDYDDSSWPGAHLSDQNVQGGPRNQTCPEISKEAYWIWSNIGKGFGPGTQWTGWDKNCYCRLDLSSGVAPSKRK